jgi:NAD(P)-dependent dehydrogenase (short-subunit alcohol dehydrogenase family)
VERFGGVDLLLNNAGIFVAKPFLDHTSAEFDALVATNLAGFFHLTREALRSMRPRGTGHVVTITTSLASQPIAGVPAAVSVLTKAGLNAATRALAIEHAADGIRFNAVAPGVVDTPMHAPESHATLKHLHPIARLGTAGEIVDAILYLEGAPFVTGEILHVDGGAHAGKW